MLIFLTAVAIDIFLGIWLGLRKARKAGGAMDRATDIGTMVVFGLPAWWVGMMAIMTFAFILPVFPSSGMHSAPPPPTSLGYLMDLLWHMTLPVLVLVILGFWGRAYLTRNVVLTTLQEDFIMSARARGLTERKILFGHTLRSAAPPIVTMSLLALLASIGGGLLFEGIFSWPGNGKSLLGRRGLNDVPVLMGNLAVTTALYIAGLAILDLIYGLPRPADQGGWKGMTKRDFSQIKALWNEFRRIQFGDGRPRAARRVRPDGASRAVDRGRSRRGHALAGHDVLARQSAQREAGVGELVHVDATMPRQRAIVAERSGDHGGRRRARCTRRKCPYDYRWDLPPSDITVRLGLTGNATYQLEIVRPDGLSVSYQKTSKSTGTRDVRVSVAQNLSDAACCSSRSKLRIRP